MKIKRRFKNLKKKNPKPATKLREQVTEFSCIVKRALHLQGNLKVRTEKGALRVRL